MHSPIDRICPAMFSPAPVVSQAVIRSMQGFRQADPVPFCTAAGGQLAPAGNVDSMDPLQPLQLRREAGGKIPVEHRRRDGDDQQAGAGRGLALGEGGRIERPVGPVSPAASTSTIRAMLAPRSAPKVSRAPRSAAAGSVVGAPLTSTAMPSGRLSPCRLPRGCSRRPWRWRLVEEDDIAIGGRCAKDTGLVQ